MRIGNKISSRRKELGMTQQDLANKLYVSVKTISKWETNRGNPEINILSKLSEALDINMSDLFDESISQEGALIETKKSYNIVYSCFEFGVAILGLIFYAKPFLIIEDEIGWGGSFFGGQTIKYIISGYDMLFKINGTNLLGSLLVLIIWVSFLTIFAHIAMGVIEITVDREDVIDKKNKASLIVSVVGVISIIFVLILSLISSIGIGFGMVMMLIVFGFALGYNIYYRTKH